jgi:predicted transposase YdaD
MEHDPLFKLLISTFFMEFLELFAPRLAREVDPDSIELHNKEIFFGGSVGKRYHADIVVRLRFRGQAAYIIVHVETQSTRDREMDRRMFIYFAGLHASERVPVFPILVASYDRPADKEPNSYNMDVAGMKVLRFKYKVVQLNRLNWRRFLRHPNPVAAALMAKMKIDPADRPRVKLEILRMIATLRLNEAGSRLIWNFAERYLQLNALETRKFKQEMDTLAPPEKENVMQVSNMWIEEGMEKGIDQGMAKVVLLLLRQRFRSLPPAMTSRIESLSGRQLSNLAKSVLQFEALADVQAWLAARRR